MNNSSGRGASAFLQLLLVAAALMGIAYYYMQSREQQAKDVSKVLHEMAPANPNSEAPTTIPQDAKSIESGVQKTLDATSEQYQKQLNQAVDQAE
jgi:hypothetical protein